MEKIVGPTPNGGVYALAYYYNEKGESVDKEHAVRGIITEFDSNDNMIMETYVVLDKNLNK